MDQKHPAAPLEADVVIIGAGLAGTAAATVLARAGRSVALIDSHEVFPREFRAEKFGPPHIDLLESLDLAQAAIAAATAIDSIDVYRFGRFEGRHRGREYGYAYSDLVNALRGALPASVGLIVGRVAGIETGPWHQTVTLADDGRVGARLLIIATGLGDAIRRRVGIGRVETRRAHSLSLGFDLDRPASTYGFESLASYGTGYDRIAYLTLFPIGATMRGNLFVYRNVDDPWIRAFRQAPSAGLAAALPGLDLACDGLGISGRVQVRPIDLTVSQGHRRGGVVLVGDAFCTTCPAPGVGVRRVLVDVDRLCNHHIPHWLATPGIDAAKIGAFYDDPVKRRSDAEAIRLSEFARSMAVHPGPVWAARRARNTLVRKGAAWIRRTGTGFVRSARSRPEGTPVEP